MAAENDLAYIGAREAIRRFRSKERRPARYSRRLSTVPRQLSPS